MAEPSMAESQIKMSGDPEIKKLVREFYDRVGWQEVSEGCYQNAAYEDLRPVSQEYIHRCHLRVLKHLKPNGRYLLDAGSGPIQYPEYLKYSRTYRKRVCLDISSVALQEARKRIGDKGLYVVGDIANLPFESHCFDGLVSLHTIHHLPHDEHLDAYLEFYRVLGEGSNAVIVNGWDDAPLMVVANLLIRFVEWSYARLRGNPIPHVQDNVPHEREDEQVTGNPPQEASRTHVSKHTAAWLNRQVGALAPLEIWTWRSVGVRFLRTLIHERWGGRTLLRILYGFEERFPYFFGKYGQYPLIVINKRTG
jgi:SAM-dependent methyltransferase